MLISFYVNLSQTLSAVVFEINSIEVTSVHKLQSNCSFIPEYHHNKLLSHLPPVRLVRTGIYFSSKLVGSFQNHQFLFVPFSTGTASPWSSSLSLSLSRQKKNTLFGRGSLVLLVDTSRAKWCRAITSSKMPGGDTVTELKKNKKRHT